MKHNTHMYEKDKRRNEKKEINRRTSSLDLYVNIHERMNIWEILSAYWIGCMNGQKLFIIIITSYTLRMYINFSSLTIQDDDYNSSNSNNNMLYASWLLVCLIVLITYSQVRQVKKAISNE